MAREPITITLALRDGRWFLGPSGNSGLLFPTREKAVDAATAWLGQGWRREVLVELEDGSLAPLRVSQF
jgi:hypothetical protein